MHNFRFKLLAKIRWQVAARIASAAGSIGLLLSAPTLTALGSENLDRFGGCTSWTVATSGHFRAAQIRGRWWLISPEGRGLFVLGLNHINELKHPEDYQRTLFAQRFGHDWEQVFAEVEKHCRAWGFNSAGFQAPQEMRATMPYVLSTKFADASFWLQSLTYVDVFAPAFALEAEAKAEAAAAEMKANPMCMAWTWTDSLCWDIQLTRKSHGTDFVSFMRELPITAPGRERYTMFLRARYNQVAALNAAYGTKFSSWENAAQADWSKLDRGKKAVLADDREFLRLIARHYYETISRPFRREHPQGLLMGDRFHLRDHPDEVLEEAAKHIDLLGIQPGDHFQASIVRLTCPDETRFDAQEFDRLHRLTGKPIIIADHQCGFFDDQTPKTGGWYQYANARDAAASYERFLRDAMSRPYIVGYFRCQYLTAYRAHIMRYKQGLLRPDGTPYEDFVAHLMQINRDLIRDFLRE